VPQKVRSSGHYVLMLCFNILPRLGYFAWAFEQTLLYEVFKGDKDAMKALVNSNILSIGM
jgi:hypothetical protein